MNNIKDLNEIISYSIKFILVELRSFNIDYIEVERWEKDLIAIRNSNKGMFVMFIRVNPNITKDNLILLIRDNIIDIL